MNELDKAIQSIGGVGKLAVLLGVVQGAVSNWRARGSMVPPEYCAIIERATHGEVTRQTLRPNDWQKIWPELAPSGVSIAPAASESVAQGVSHV